MIYQRRCSEVLPRQRRMLLFLFTQSTAGEAHNSSATSQPTIEEPEPAYLQEPLPEDPQLLQDLLQKECLRSHPSRSLHPCFPRSPLPAFGAGEERLPVPARPDASSLHASSPHRQRPRPAPRRQRVGTSLHERRHRRRLPASSPPALLPRPPLPRGIIPSRHRLAVDSPRASRQHWHQLPSL